MSQEQKPSVGRVVHFHIGSITRPLAAMITRVHDASGDVDVIVFDINDEGETAIYREVKYSSGPKDSHWSWPPRV